MKNIKRSTIGRQRHTELDDLPWVACPRFEGYEVTADGCHVRVIDATRRLRSELAIGTHNLGYKVVTLVASHGGRDAYGNGVGRRKVGVHRLVADAFLGECPDGKEVDHKDFDKANNAAVNLQYLTHRENVRRVWDAGRHPNQQEGWVGPMTGRPVSVETRGKMAAAKMGARHFRAVAPDVMRILALCKAGRNTTEIAAAMGLKRTVVGDVLRGTHWSVRKEYVKRGAVVDAVPAQVEDSACNTPTTLLHCPE